MSANKKPAFTYDQVLAAVARDDNTGICVLCGQEQGNIEPDARKYPCENCERKSVFGAEDLLLHFALAAATE